MYIYVWLVFTFSDFSLYSLHTDRPRLSLLLSPALLAWGGEDEPRAGPHLRAGLECPRDRHLLGQPLLCLHGRLLLTRGG